MSFLKRLFPNAGPEPRLALAPLYRQIVTQARQPHWYMDGGVDDNVDGRFDMVAAILSLVLLRLEQDGAHRAEMALLTELFVEDMDGQLREIGIGDMIVGKHVGRVMSALGGRLGAFREALADPATLDDCLLRNVYRSEDVEPAKLQHVRQGLLDIQVALAKKDISALLSGEGQW